MCRSKPCARLARHQARAAILGALVVDYARREDADAADLGSDELAPLVTAAENIEHELWSAVEDEGEE
jgi:hypothetical protein